MSLDHSSIQYLVCLSLLEGYNIYLFVAVKNNNLFVFLKNTMTKSLKLKKYNLKD